MKLSTDQVPPRGRAALARRGDAEGVGLGGVAQCHAWLLLGADGGRMEGGWPSSSSPTSPRPPLSSDKQRVCQTQCCQAEPELAPLYPRLLGVKVGSGDGGVGEPPLPPPPSSQSSIQEPFC